MGVYNIAPQIVVITALFITAVQPAVCLANDNVPISCPCNRHSQFDYLAQLSRPVCATIPTAIIFAEPIIISKIDAQIDNSYSQYSAGASVSYSGQSQGLLIATCHAAATPTTPDVQDGHLTEVQAIMCISELTSACRNAGY